MLLMPSKVSFYGVNITSLIWEDGRGLFHLGKERNTVKLSSDSKTCFSRMIPAECVIA